MYKNLYLHFRGLSFYTFMEVELLGQIVQIYFKTLINIPHQSSKVSANLHSQQRDIKVLVFLLTYQFQLATFY